MEEKNTKLKAFAANECPSKMMSLSKNVTNIQNKIIEDLNQKLNEHLKKYVLQNLNELGYQFTEESEFFTFVSKRVTRIAYEDNPNDYFLYLDYGTKNSKLVGVYSHKISWDFENNMVNVTIG